jgi:hypothetical protein
MKYKFGDKLKALVDIRGGNSIINKERKHVKSLDIKKDDILFYVCEGEIEDEKRVLVYSPEKDNCFLPLKKNFESFYKKIIN